MDEVQSVAREAGMPLKVLDLCGAGLEGLYGAPLGLIRPDHHVAWRGAVFEPAILDILRGVRPALAHHAVETAA